MKISAPIKGFIISMLSVLLAFGIYFLFLQKRNYYVADNPTPNTYYFVINSGGEQIIAAGQTVRIDLHKGQNRVAVSDANRKKLYDSAFNVVKERGLLNIAHGDYYINTQYYGYNINKDSLVSGLPKTVIDGKAYFGNPKKSSRLYTEDFYYNVDEDYDKIIKNVQKVESRSKIFRKQDFLNYYKDYYKF